MASYKDTTPSTFNPYIEQRPVEAMAKVGMYKQQRFDEGVKKIQESIDNVAGLDVVRDIDKQYLQSKLNQLGSQLSNVAGGDFSNFSLINSVNGMTNQIAKDPNVINAVSSATRYRKDLETIQGLKEKGEWAESNQLEYNKEVTNWYDSDDLNSSYKANVSPYINVQEESQKIIKALAKDEYNIEVMQDPSSGKYYDIMTNQEVKELTPEKIQTALKTGLSPQAWRQLSLDGKLKYNNVSDQGFVNQLNDGYENRFNLLSERRSDLVNAEISAKNPADKLKLQNQIAQLDQMIKANQQEYDSVSSGFSSGDVDSAKAQFYTMDWMDNISQAFSSRSIKTTTKESPYFSVQMKKDQFALAQAKYDEQRRQNKRVNADKKKELELLEGNLNNTFTISTDPKDTDEIVKNSKIETDTNITTANVERAKLAKRLGWDDTVRYIDVDGDGNYNPSVDRLNEEKGLTQFDRMMSVSERSNYTNVQPIDMDAMKDYLDVQRNADTSLFRENTIAQEVERQIPSDIDSLIPQEYVGRTWEGFTAAETAVLLSSFDKYVRSNVGMSFGAAPVTYDTYDDERARVELTDQEYSLYENIYKNKEGQSILAGNDYVKSAMNLMDEVKDQVEDINDRRDELEKELYLQTLPIPQGLSVGIDISDKVAKNKMQGIVATVVTAINERDGYPGLNEDDAAKLLKIEKGITSATVLTDSRELRVSGGSTGDKMENVLIPLTDEQYDQVRGMFNIETESTPEVQYFNKNVLPRLLSTGPTVGERETWTTAAPEYNQIANTIVSEYPTNTNFENGYFNNFDFPNVNLYEIAANLTTNDDPDSDDARYYWQLAFRSTTEIPSPQDPNVMIPSTTTFENQAFEKPVSKEQVATFLQKLDDAIIFRMINGRDITLEDIKDMAPKVQIPN
jgi:hypothetical protein